MSDEPQGLERFEVDRISRDERAATQTYRRGRRFMEVPTAAIRLTIRGERGAVISDVMTRDEFLTLLGAARDIVNDG